jgi:hypothetical protein
MFLLLSLNEFAILGWIEPPVFDLLLMSRMITRYSSVNLMARHMLRLYRVVIIMAES